MELEDIVSSQTSLQKLISMAPQVWQEVFSDIKAQVVAGRMDSLATLSFESHGTLQNLTRMNSPKTQPSAIKDAAIRARMTILAVEQFSAAVVGNAGATVSLRDRLLFRLAIQPLLVPGNVFTQRSFDRRWRWMKDKAWAAGEIQRCGFWSVPTREILERVAAQADRRPILELGAGRGLLAAGLRHCGAEVRAIDDYSWAKSPEEPENTAVEKMDAATALRDLKPSVVICSWPPPGNLFENIIFSTKSVQLYLVILSRHRFASGDWSAYQNQQAFTCSSSEPLNQLLRPRESDQQIYIFRRKSLLIN